MTVRCTDSASPREAVTDAFSEPYRAARRRRQRAASLGGSVTSSNELANRMLHRAGADLSMLVTETPQGPYPYAGTPWFSTPFGRDGLITALEMLWLDPALAQGVLRYLAPHQATELDARADAEPGKILHETRACEMANLGEVPFGHYYGSIDSTPLFVLLAARYFERTGDRRPSAQLWPNIEAALAWIDNYGDRDGDGFVEYYRVSENGLTNQGWKDSADSIMHADGPLAHRAHRPVRGAGLCLCRQAGRSGPGCGAGLSMNRPPRWPAAAEKLRTRFRREILDRGAGHLCPGAGRRQAALPGAQLQCRTGAGLRYCRAGTGRRVVAATLMTPEMFSGWGVRTLSADAPRFNPMSYHNGSVWPHDNALIALGLARYGLKRGRVGHFRRPVRCRRPYGHDALSGIVLRLSPPPRHGADALSGGLRAAGLGQCGAVRAAAGLPGHWIWISLGAKSASTIRNCRDSWRRSASTTWSWRTRRVNLRLRRRGVAYRGRYCFAAWRYRNKNYTVG